MRGKEKRKEGVDGKLSVYREWQRCEPYAHSRRRQLVLQQNSQFVSTQILDPIVDPISDLF